MCYGQMLEASLTRARKQHRCTECGRVIEPGTKYERSAWIIDGDFQAEKRCRKCVQLFATATELGAFDYPDCLDDPIRDVVRYELETGSPTGWRETMRKIRRVVAERFGR